MSNKKLIDIIQTVDEKRKEHIISDERWEKEIPIIEEYMKKLGIDRYCILSDEITESMNKNDSKTTVSISARCYPSDQLEWKTLMENNDNAAESFKKLISNNNMAKKIKKLTDVKNNVRRWLNIQTDLTEQEIFMIRDVLDDLQDFIVNNEKIETINHEKTFKKFINTLNLLDRIDCKELYGTFKEDSLYIAETVDSYTDAIVEKDRANIKFITAFKQKVIKERQCLNEIASKLNL